MAWPGTTGSSIAEAGRRDRPVDPAAGRRLHVPGSRPRHDRPALPHRGPDQARSRDRRRRGQGRSDDDHRGHRPTLSATCRRSTWPRASPGRRDGRRDLGSLGSAEWIGVCSEDLDRMAGATWTRRTGTRSIVFDPASQRAVRVLPCDLPEFTDATITGQLRREERAVDRRAGSIRGLRFDGARACGLATATSSTTVPRRGARRWHSSWPAILARGRRGHRRRPGRRLPDLPQGRRPPSGGRPRRSRPASASPLRITRRRPDADRARARPRGAGRAGPVRHGAAESSDEPAVPVEVPVETTLIVERTGYPQGVPLGLGQLGDGSRPAGD